MDIKRSIDHWTSDHDAHAKKQGWSLFCGNDKYLYILSIDEPEEGNSSLGSDEEAIDFVLKKAAVGDKTALLALYLEGRPFNRDCDLPVFLRDSQKNNPMGWGVVRKMLIEEGYTHVPHDGQRIPLGEFNPFNDLEMSVTAYTSRDVSASLFVDFLTGCRVLQAQKFMIVGNYARISQGSKKVRYYPIKITTGKRGFKPDPNQLADLIKYFRRLGAQPGQAELSLFNVHDQKIDLRLVQIPDTKEGV